jgi:hypothetical protein
MNPGFPKNKMLLRLRIYMLNLCISILNRSAKTRGHRLQLFFRGLSEFPAVTMIAGDEHEFHSSTGKQTAGAMIAV